MTSFKIINDDVAVRGLQEKNKTPVTSSPIMPVKASNPTQKSPENAILQSTRTERRHHEPYQSLRRQIDRRTTERAVLLDTRSQHDRRIKTGRSSDTAISKKITTLRGIDETI